MMSLKMMRTLLMVGRMSRVTSTPMRLSSSVPGTISSLRSSSDADVDKVCANGMERFKTSTANEMTEILLNYGCPPNDVAEVIKLSPHLLSSPPKKVQAVLQVLQENGFSPEQCIQFVSLNFEAIQLELDTFKEILDEWREIGISEKNVAQLLSEWPNLFQEDIRNVRRRIHEFKLYFDTGKIFRILLACPNVITEKWEDIEEKLDYMSDEMIITRMDIQKTEALRHSLNHIKLRHTFMTRAGLYKRPNPKSTVPTKNPSLSSIVCADDQEFATKVCHMTLEEYLVFQEMYNLELEAEYMSDSDSDTYSE